MDIKRNPDLISLISNIRLEIAEAGLAMLDNRWNNSDVRSPFHGFTISAAERALCCFPPVSVV